MSVANPAKQGEVQSAFYTYEVTTETTLPQFAFGQFPVTGAFATSTGFTRSSAPSSWRDRAAAARARGVGVHAQGDRRRPSPPFSRSGGIAAALCGSARRSPYAALG